MKPNTLPKQKVVVKKEVKNYLNQQQLDEFAVLLRDLYMSVMDKEQVARAFCEHFGVKDKDRFYGLVQPEPAPEWEKVT